MTHRPLQAPELKGTFVALATLFNEREEIDYRKQNWLIEDLIDAGVDGLVVMGTTGQAATMDYDEHLEEAVRTIEIVKGRVPVIVGAGSNDTRKAIALSRKIEERVGPTTFLHTTGYYLKPSSEAATLHYLRVARAIQGNIVLYNVPGRVVTRLEPEHIVLVHKEMPEKIIGLKQADPTPEGLEATRIILANTLRDKFAVVSGEDDKVYELMSMGASGVISATANCCPRLFTNITRNHAKGDFEQARLAQESAMPFVNYCFKKPGNNPANLNFLFQASVRGCNFSLGECFGWAKISAAKFRNTLFYEKLQERVKEWLGLTSRGLRFIDESDPALIGIDLKKYS